MHIFLYTMLRSHPSSNWKIIAFCNRLWNCQNESDASINITQAKKSMGNITVEPRIITIQRNYIISYLITTINIITIFYAVITIGPNNSVWKNSTLWLTCRDLTIFTDDVYEQSVLPFKDTEPYCWLSDSFEALRFFHYSNQTKDPCASWISWGRFSILKIPILKHLTDNQFLAKKYMVVNL